MAELRHLRVLRAVRHTGSFSAAAHQLDYTQPAVSKIIASLEREIGAVLVDRDARPIRLTDAGEALARHAERIFEQLLAAEGEVRAIADLDGGTLRLGTFSSAGAAFFVEALRHLRRLHPEIDVSVVEGMPSRLVERLRAGGLDLALVFDFPAAGEDRTAGLEAQHLLDDPFDVVLPADHPLASVELIAFEDLAAERWVLPEFGPDSPTMKLLARGCAAAGFEPSILYQVNDCDLTLSMVAAGEGISALPRLMLPREAAGVSVRPFRAGAPVRRITAVRLPSRYVAPPTTKFLELLEAAAVELAHSPEFRPTPAAPDSAT